MTRPDLTLAREFEAAFAWWQAAGVDCDFTDDATAWLADAPPAVAPTSAEPAGSERHEAAAVSGTAREQVPARSRAAPPSQAPRSLRRDLLGESPPGDLAAFRAWWMTAPELDTAKAYPRIAPRGEAGAALMVLVPQPEENDRERLLSGRQGRLLGNILAAMGLKDDAIYIAAALPCHTPMADLPSLAEHGMDAVTAHHIMLAAPQRVLILGTALAPMLGAAAADGLQEIDLGTRNVPVMVSETLEAMMDIARLKARFWRRWMEWSATH